MEMWRLSHFGKSRAEEAYSELVQEYNINHYDQYSHADFAASIGTSRTSVSRFFSQIPIKKPTFINACNKLKLNFQEVGELTAKEKIVKEILESNSSNLDDFKSFQQSEKLSNSMLSSEYTKRFSDIFEDKIKNFFGRSYVIKDFEKFIEGDSGYYILKGEPGEGKSSILAKYASEHKCLYYFNRRAEGQNTASLFLENICNQIIEYYSIKKFYDKESWSLGATESGVFLKELLLEVSSKIASDEKIIIVVDALDEVDIQYQKSGTNILYLPQNLPKNVYFLVSTRKEVEKLEGRLKFSNKKEKLLEEFPGSIADIEDFIGSFFENDIYGEILSLWLENRNINQKKFIDEITGKTTDLRITERRRKRERNFMFVNTIMTELSKPDGMYQNSGFEELPSDLNDYYNDHWMLMEISADKCRIICVICESEQPTPPHIVSVKSGIDAVEVELVLKFWGQFLRKKKIESLFVYSLYHESYRDFVYKKPEVKSACVNPQEVNKRISERYKKMFDL